MSFTPLKQYKAGDALGSTPQGMLTLVKDVQTGFATPLTLGYPGPDQSTFGAGLLGYLKAIYDTLGFFDDTGSGMSSVLAGIRSSITSSAVAQYTNNFTLDSTSKAVLMCADVQGSASRLYANNNGSLKVVDGDKAQGLAQGSLTVSTSSVLVTTYNQARSGLLLKNVSTSSQKIWLSFDDSAAVTDKGVTLEQGESYQTDPGCVTQDRVFAIASASGALLNLQEWNR